MLHSENDRIKELLLKGCFGLEKESLRVLPDGTLSHSPHPFSNSEPYITRDFCENQTEINTPVEDSAAKAVDTLEKLTGRIHGIIAAQKERELLWPFSNPPYVRKETDVPVAAFTGKLSAKTRYREYLSDRYGRYKMLLSGIHVNYSFARELLEADYNLGRSDDFQEYKNRLYVELARKTAAFGWIVTALTAASPVLDSSFVEKGVMGNTVFSGMASIRCSELGYWNTFAPVFDYTDIRHYAGSIRNYVEDGLLAAPSELYYPIRLKPRGENSLKKLYTEGADHIELRMVDLNPLEISGVCEKDIRFIQLLLVYLASGEPMELTKKDQVQAVQNFKNAAHYDLKTVKIVMPGQEAAAVADVGHTVISKMRAFFREFPSEVQEVLDFEEEKFIVPEKRYAWQIRKDYAEGYVEKGLLLAEEMQKRYLDNLHPLCPE